MFSALSKANYTIRARVKFLVTKCFQPFPKRKILDSLKLKEFADDNIKLDENGRKLANLVENTVGKREMARYEPFLLFPQCFQKTCNGDT